MKTILFLSVRMCPGWGVSVVVEELARVLSGHGVRSVVGCLEHEGSWRHVTVRALPANVEDVLALVDREGVDVVVAHTSPYFELLPQLSSYVPCIAYEHGDPTPAFFAGDEAERRNVARAKRDDVYPAVAAVATVSDFLRFDIDWPAARVIPNGCDHLPDLGRKGLHEFFPVGSAPLRIGTLARLGHGEARYKGNALFRELVAGCRGMGLPVQCEVMGRGTPEDALQFEKGGMVVHLNATEREKIEYLRGLDLFVSCSQWEGFNLPLVEAAAVGTAALAFDAGAHPEVTPLLASNLPEALALIARYAIDRALLNEHSAMCYEFVRSRFRWDAAAVALLDLCRACMQPAIADVRMSG